AEASLSPDGANGLVFIPYFSGGLTPIHNPDARGIYFGLNLTHTRGDLFRALLEGISAGTRRILDTYREVDAFPKKVFAVGGGTKNKIWLQSNSDMSNIEQHICKYSLGASYGDAFLAALALGNVKKEDIFDWNPFDKTIYPNPKKVYDETYPHFIKLYEETKDIASEISAIQRKSI
ncbi:MAG: carbohydrate kinase, partial [Rhodobacteraceae bacterium]|nr:carbohydrate kinase [Paracoccaceae bacterium]